MALSSTTSTGRPRSRPGRAGPGRAGSGWTRRSGAVKWKVLPWPGVALDPDPAAHQLDQPRGDGQAQAGAAVPPRRRAVGLREGLEDRRLLLGAGCRCRCRVTAKCSADPPAARPFLRGVGLDAETTTSPCSVNLMALPTRLTRICRSRPGSPTSASGTSGGDVAGQLQPLAGAARRASVLSVSPRQSRRSNGDRLELELAGLDLGEVEDVVDDRQQRVGRRLDQFQVLALLGRQRRCRGPARSCR